MRGNSFSALAEHTNSAKHTTTSKQAVPALSKPAASTQPDEKQQANGNRSRSRNRNRGRGRGRGQIVPMAQPEPEPEPESWDEAFAQMQADFEKEMNKKDPSDGWGETPKEKLKRQLVEQWRVNVVPGANP